MEDKMVDYTKERLRIIDEEIQKCHDEERIKALKTIKESNIKFFEEIKKKKVA